MTLPRTRLVFVPSPSLVPAHAGQWGLDDSEWDEDWGVRRSLSFVPWHAHRVSEGYVRPDNPGLYRALREETEG